MPNINGTPVPMASPKGPLSSGAQVWSNFIL